MKKGPRSKDVSTFSIGDTMVYRVGTALLQHFQASEFKLPDKMDALFLLFLDAVRDRAGMGFVLNSDARSPEHNAQVGGVVTSLHLFDPLNDLVKARAVDFSIEEFKNHVVPWTTFAKIAEAVISVSHEQNVSYELEFQYGAVNKHVHLGLFREREHPSHLVVKGDAGVPA